MSLLESIRGPRDLKRLDVERLPQLAAEIRDFLVTTVARTGGHLGPNLGVVELTVALHRVFDSPRDKLLWDVGHQCYVHKLLTGRDVSDPRWAKLKSGGGLSGYPSQSESEHDVIENSHASAALSYADGLAKAYQIRGEDRSVVTVIGDGALTGGMAWEALNNIAAGKDRRVVIVVNDNGRSYSPTIGGLADHLASLRLSQGYEQALELIRSTLSRTPLVGPPMYETLHGIKKGLKDIIQPQVMFEDLGIKYVGPIDGHDEQAVEQALRRARTYGGPVIVHCLTRKGFGYPPAENDEEDQFHQTGVFDPVTGRPTTAAKTSWTDVFSEELVALGGERDDIVAITAAMLHPTGLAAFQRAYPERVFDVGIAEQHAATSAAGLALGGMHPVFAVYSTFLNRAFDQMLMDVALHRLPVTFALDRAGVTGTDGPSHNGMWDLSILNVVPGLRVAVPRDAPRIRELLREAVAVDDGPTALRYSKGTVGEELAAAGRLGGMDVLRFPADTEEKDVLLVAVGPMGTIALDAAERLSAHGIGVTVVDPRWVKPLDAALLPAAADHRMVAVVEDAGRVGAVGDAVSRLLHDSGDDTPVRTFGLPQEFLVHAKRESVLTDIGLTGQDVARAITESVANLSGAEVEIAN
ncbi:MAG TPA: 1-deoxy-D-xylulose-5-phosphate synthase [Streptosporangiaceae bacterium]